jgi:hypothetical protein
MSDRQRYSKLAADARTSAVPLDRAGRTSDAQKARADAIRYDRLAKLATLGSVRVG